MQAFFEDIKELFFGNDRVSDLAQLSRKQGFRFWKNYSFRRLPYEIKSFGLFKGKNQKRLRSLLEKVDTEKGIKYQIFDFHNYKDYGTKKTTAIYISSETFDFPEFEVRPKDISEKLTGLFLRQDIFNHFPKFTDAYTVKSLELDHMEYLMSNEVLEILLKEEKMIMEGKHNHLILHKKNDLLEPNELIPFFEKCKRITELMLEDNSNDFV